MTEQTRNPNTGTEGNGAQQPCIDARELLGKGNTAQILLDGQVYFLRLTRQEKLILTK
jgi:hemin uptake protein HemP